MRQKSPRFSQFWKGWKNLQTRRQRLSILSASLIVIGLASGNVFHWDLGFNLGMIAAALVAGWDIAVRAVRSLRNKHASIELLVTIASLGAIWIGEYWEAAAVTFLFLFGAYLEARTLAATRQVLGSLLDLAPLRAIVQREGTPIEVSPEEVRLGEKVLVKAGSKVPVDGSVLQGYSAVDESAITGEPVPEEKSPGSRVFAGTVNGNALLTIEATGVGSDTTLARIIRRVEEAQEQKAPTQKFIEKFARWYTPAIIALSVVSYLITRDLELALTLLVIGCPGALVISTPVSVVAGIGRAAKAGILIKGGEYLEGSGKISAIAFDKTGTLTRGKPKLTDILTFEAEMVPAGACALPQTGVKVSNRWNEAQADVLYWAAAAEAGSGHPLARAITEEAGTIWNCSPSVSFSDTVPGKGIRAIVDGQDVLVGSGEWLKDNHILVHIEALEQLKSLKSQGKTAVFAAVAGQLIGGLGIADTVRENAPAMIQKLRQAGVKKIVMLTGDDQVTAEAVARATGVDELRAGLLPEDKLDEIKKLKAQGYHVAMVGDGINDSPALAAADIGIAMGAAGTDVAIETADIALMADDLMKIPEAVKLSRYVLRNIYQNVAIALVTVTVLLLGVLFGRVHMAGGMLIHEASVLIVIANGMRLLRMRTAS